MTSLNLSFLESRVFGMHRCEMPFSKKIPIARIRPQIMDAHRCLQSLSRSWNRPGFDSPRFNEGINRSGGKVRESSVVLSPSCKKYNSRYNGGARVQKRSLPSPGIVGDGGCRNGQREVERGGETGEGGSSWNRALTRIVSLVSWRVSARIYLSRGTPDVSFA